VTKARGYGVGQPIVTAGGTLTTFAGFDCSEQDVATNTVGYSYGDTVATDGNWAFNSASSTHPSRFGGGVVNKVDTFTSGSNMLSAAHYCVVVQSTATIVLPAVADVEPGQSYVIFNDKGATTLNISSASTLKGDLSIPASNQRTVFSNGVNWYIGANNP
jgi:hypothetical protein